jgi:hypothetical protein
MPFYLERTVNYAVLNMDGYYYVPDVSPVHEVRMSSFPVEHYTFNATQVRYYGTATAEVDLPVYTGAITTSTVSTLTWQEQYRDAMNPGSKTVSHLKLRGRLERASMLRRRKRVLGRTEERAVRCLRAVLGNRLADEYRTYGCILVRDDTGWEWMVTPAYLVTSGKHPEDNTLRSYRDPYVTKLGVEYRSTYLPAADRVLANFFLIQDRDQRRWLFGEACTWSGRRKTLKAYQRLMRKEFLESDPYLE